MSAPAEPPRDDRLFVGGPLTGEVRDCSGVEVYVAPRAGRTARLTSVSAEGLARLDDVPLARSYRLATLDLLGRRLIVMLYDADLPTPTPEVLATALLARDAHDAWEHAEVLVDDVVRGDFGVRA